MIRPELSASRTPYPRASATPPKWGPHRRTSKNIGVNFPLVMGCTRNTTSYVTYDMYYGIFKRQILNYFNKLLTLRSRRHKTSWAFQPLTGWLVSIIQKNIIWKYFQNNRFLNFYTGDMEEIYGKMFHAQYNQKGLQADDEDQSNFPIICISSFVVLICLIWIYYHFAPVVHR